MDSSLTGRESQWSTDAQTSIAGKHMVTLFVQAENKLGLCD